MSWVQLPAEHSWLTWPFAARTQVDGIRDGWCHLRVATSRILIIGASSGSLPSRTFLLPELAPVDVLYASC